MEPLKFEAVTESTVQEFQFKWTIENYSFLCRNNENQIMSPIFQSKFNGSEMETMITLYAKSEIWANMEFIELKGRLWFKCDFVLLNSRGKKLAASEESSVDSYRRGYEIERQFLISREELLKGISHDNKLILICNVKVSTDDSHFSKIINNVPSVFDHQSGILNDFGKLRMDVDYSDMTISVCGKEFRVHKMILAARSPVFASMFKHDMKESKSGQVEIDDMKPEVFEQFLDFVYKGNAKVDQFAWELLPAADKYGVQDLKATCEDVLGNNITKENCIATVLLGDLHSAEKLKKTAMNFILAKSVEIDKNYLDQLKDPALILEFKRVSIINRKKGITTRTFK